MTLPSFLLIGAARSGTTSLYHYCKQHPDVYMSPVKEPKFFALEGEDLDYRGPGDRRRTAGKGWVTRIEEYRKLFKGATGHAAVGEASTVYLYDQKAPARIQHYVPNTKLIAILRDPAERAYSNFLYMTRTGREPLSEFSDALQDEESRIQDNWMPSWHYRRSGFYHTQLRRYFDEFPSDRIKVYLFEDLTADPSRVLEDLFEFLGVDPTFAPDVTERHNPAGTPRSRALHNFLTSPSPVKAAVKAVIPSGLRRRAAEEIRNQNLVRTPLPLELRRQLIDTYRDDILKLQDLIGRDLSKWLE